MTMTREQALDLLPLLAGGDLDPAQAEAVQAWLEWDPALAAEAATFTALERRLQAALAPAAAESAPGEAALDRALQGQLAWSDTPPERVDERPGAATGSATGAAPVVTVRRRCPYCHDAVDAAALVVCGSCATPHHGQCFEQNGGCSLLGCGGTSSIAAAGPAAVVCGACSRHTPADAPFCAWCGTAVAKDGAPAPLHARPAAAAAPYDWRRYAAAAALLLACSLGVGGAFGWQQSIVVEQARVQYLAAEAELAEVTAAKLVAELARLQEEHLRRVRRERRPGEVVAERYVTGVDALLDPVQHALRSELRGQLQRSGRWYRFHVVGGPSGYAIVARFRWPVGDRRVQPARRSFYATSPDQVRTTGFVPVVTRDRRGNPAVRETSWPDAAHLPAEADEPRLHRPAPRAVTERLQSLEADGQLARALVYCQEQARAHPDDQVLQERVEELKARLLPGADLTAWGRTAVGDRFEQSVVVDLNGAVMSRSSIVHEVTGRRGDDVVVTVTTTTANGEGTPMEVTTEAVHPARLAPGAGDPPTGSRERTRLDVPAGTFECWRTTTRMQGAMGEVVMEVWHDDDLPLPLQTITTTPTQRTTTRLTERPEGRSQ